jgi:ABC-type branched-subunit amino acid transport system ATPase component
MRKALQKPPESAVYTAAELIFEESLWHGKNAFSKDGSGNHGSFVTLADEHAQEVAGLLNLYSQRKVEIARAIIEREHASLGFRPLPHFEPFLEGPS